MTAKLKLSSIPDNKPVKVSVVLPPGSPPRPARLCRRDGGRDRSDSAGTSGAYRTDAAAVHGDGPGFRSPTEGVPPSGVNFISSRAQSEVPRRTRPANV